MFEAVGCRSPASCMLTPLAGYGREDGTFVTSLRCGTRRFLLSIRQSHLPSSPQKNSGLEVRPRYCTESTSPFTSYPHPVAQPRLTRLATLRLR